MADIRVIKTYFQLRRGKSEAWHRVNPVLLAGEPGFELDTNLLKIGDGVNNYADLPYINSHQIAFEEPIPLSEEEIKAICI